MSPSSLTSAPRMLQVRSIERGDLWVKKIPTPTGTTGGGRVYVSFYQFWVPGIFDPKPCDDGGKDHSEVRRSYARWRRNVQESL